MGALLVTTEVRVSIRCRYWHKVEVDVDLEAIFGVIDESIG